ncbi:putative temperature dependent protein affecting M2 dsRNA replication [Elsinoe fawcettii]|nr:putative temperature dependent protein affecting M2 dsRNA replication [Elsinoe fawcettii]
MINGFNEWAASERLIQSSPLEQLKDRCLAIDAENHIQKILTADAKEPLLPALGGTPFNIENTIDEHIKRFEDANIKPFFIFHGISASGEQKKVVAAELLAKKIDEAWDLYNASNPDQAVAAFGTACSFDSEHIYRYVQSIFHRKNVPFLVAPYSAYAQIAYLENEKIVDAIQGPSELLAFNTQRLILDIDFEKKNFSWVTRQACIDNLAGGNIGLFNDASLLAGSNLLQVLPQLDNDATPARSPKIKAAADLLKRMNMGGNTICLQYQDEPLNRQFDYLENYRKALMSLQHHVITTFEGEMVTLNKESAPNDVHAFIGQRLPDEIYCYVSRGAIGTRVLSWRTSGQIVEKPPVDGGASITYQTLIRDKIVPQRVRSLALLSQSLHRFYQHNDVSLRLFFGAQDGQGRKLNVNDGGADIKASVASWHVPKDTISSRLKALKVNEPSLYFAVESLTSDEFANSTVTPKKSNTKLMTDSAQIKCNALWRYLQLNDYVNRKDHTLSSVGKTLQVAYKAAISKGLKPEEFGEPLLLGVELLRLKLLNYENLFPVPPYHGAPFRGSDIDQRNTLLVSRVACLGRLKHKPIGYTGPLSRHLLAYKSLISVARQSQRDMLDMNLATMFLDGDVDRNIPEKDLKDIGFSLPYLQDNDCGLGIAVKHYLDELSAAEDPTAKEARETVKDKGRTSWFPHVVDYAGSLEYAFSLWDAIYKAVQEASTSLVDSSAKGEWKNVDAWLKDRR